MDPFEWQPKTGKVCEFRLPVYWGQFTRVYAIPFTWIPTAAFQPQRGRERRPSRRKCKLINFHSNENKSFFLFVMCVCVPFQAFQRFPLPLIKAAERAPDHRNYGAWTLRALDCSFDSFCVFYSESFANSHCETPPKARLQGSFAKPTMLSHFYRNSLFAKTQFCKWKVKRWMI